MIRPQRFAFIAGMTRPVSRRAAMKLKESDSSASALVALSFAHYR
jgi:hypothetical protein